MPFTLSTFSHQVANGKEAFTASAVELPTANNAPTVRNQDADKHQ